MNGTEIMERIQTGIPGSRVRVDDATGEGNHWEVIVSGPLFKEKTRIECHKSVMDLFSVELKSGEIHALALKILR